MGKIIKFIKKDDKGYTKETYQFLTYRLHDFIDFITSHASDEDRDIWCEKFIAALKFLGDYKLDEELEDDFYLVTGVEDGWIKVDKGTWEKYPKSKERSGK